MPTIRLTWTDNNSGALHEEGYSIYRSTVPMNTASLPAPLATLPPDVVEYLDATVLAGVEYYYIVSTFLGALVEYSTEVSETLSGVQSTNPVFTQYDEFSATNMQTPDFLVIGDILYMTYATNFLTSIAMKTYTISTKAESAETIITTNDGLDPIWVNRGGGTLWVITSDINTSGSAKLVVYVSTDSGATWDGGTTLNTEATGGKYEDLSHAIDPVTGDVILMAEWEIVEKGASEIHCVVYDEGTATWGARTVVIANDGKDHEGPAMFIDPVTPNRVYAAIAFNDDGISYDYNAMHLIHTDNSGATWSAPVPWLTQHSHVEYGVAPRAGKLWVNSTRMHSSGNTDDKNIIGVHRYDGVANTDVETNWNQDQGQLIVYDGYADVRGGSERAFITRDASAGTDFNFKATLSAQDSSPTVDIRMVWGFQDINNTYVWVMQGVNSTVYKRVGGTFTALDLVTSPVIVAGTDYDFEVDWDSSTGVTVLKIDGVTIHSFTDTSISAPGRVGFAADGSTPDHQPVRCKAFSATADSSLVWAEDWTGYATFFPLGSATGATGDDGNFVSQIFQSGANYYVPVRNNSGTTIILYNFDLI